MLGPRNYVGYYICVPKRHCTIQVHDNYRRGNKKYRIVWCRIRKHRVIQLPVKQQRQQDAFLLTN